MTHVSLSIGWIFAVLAYVVLVFAAMTRPDAHTLRGAWIAMEIIGWSLIVPLALSSLVTGIGMSLGTPWGLFRHYWILVSLALTSFATAVLLQHMRTVSSFSEIARRTDAGGVSALRIGLRGELLHSGLGLLLLIGIEVLNVCKPQGMTRYGRRKASEVAPAAPGVLDGRRSRKRPDSPAGRPPWVTVVGIHAFVLALFFLVMHLAGGGLRNH